MTSAITREWKTRRISVIISTTNGKKDRIALAATEKAKVCTSVRSRYLTVERIRLGDRRRARRASFAGFVSCAVGGVEMGGVTTGEAKSYQRDGGIRAEGRTEVSISGYRTIS